MATGLDSEMIRFVLVQPQLAENVGAVARAMANFGFHELFLVAPLCDHLDANAIATSTGAETLLHNAKIVPDLSAALADCHWVYGTCDKQRHLIKHYIPLPALNSELNTKSVSDKIAVVFGPERTGLSNDILSRCHGIIQIPTMPDFSSINLAQAVILISYQLSLQHKSYRSELVMGETQSATQAQLQAFLSALESTLDENNYWRVASKKPLMWLNLQNIFTRLQLTTQDIRTLWGMFNTIIKNK